MYARVEWDVEDVLEEADFIGIEISEEDALIVLQKAEQKICTAAHKAGSLAIMNALEDWEEGKCAG